MKTLLDPFAALGISLLLLLAGVTGAHATVITPFANRAAFDAAFPGAVLEDWDGFAAGTTFLDGSTTSGITYTSSAGDALVTASFVPSTSPNSLGDTSVGFFSAGDSMTFGFSTLLTAFGIDINTFAATAGAYTATTNGGDVISSVFDPFPGFSTGQFVGFSSDTPFSAVTIAATTGFPYTLDTLRGVTPIPEPSSLGLIGIGLAGVGLSRRRWRKSCRGNLSVYPRSQKPGVLTQYAYEPTFV